MEIIAENTMPDGTYIRIEDWYENYAFCKPSTTIAAYPVSKYTLEGQFAPKAGERFRAQFDFDTAEETKEVFDSLVNGSKQLADYVDKLYWKKHEPCITGRIEFCQ